MENEEKSIQDNIELNQNGQIDSIFAQEDDAIEEAQEESNADENSILQKETELLEEKIEEQVQSTSVESDFSFLDAISEEQSVDEASEVEEANESEEEIKPAELQDIVSVVEVDEAEGESDELITVRPVKFQEFEQTPPKRMIKKNLDIMQDISMHVSVELGRTKSSIREVMEMEQGSVVELDKIAGEQVEVFVNDKLVAKGEVIVIEDKFGVRITSTNIQKQL